MNSKNILLIASALIFLASCGKDSNGGNAGPYAGGSEQVGGTTTIDSKESISLKAKVLPTEKAEISCEFSENYAVSFSLPEVAIEVSVEDYLTQTMKKNWSLLKSIDASQAQGLYKCIELEIKKHVKKEE